MTAPTRPILRYHGGKWRLAPWIIGHMPAHRIYVEPYCGAASVLLRKPRAYSEVINDLDGEVLNVFRVMQDPVTRAALHEMMLWTPFAHDEYELSFETADDPVEQARRTVIRSMMGFGSNALCREIHSGFRANSNRSGTTPAHDWTHYPALLEAFGERLRGVVIENRPALEIIRQHDSEITLHYCDPPYVHDTRALVSMHGHHGYSHEMTDDDHRELAAALRQVQGMVLLSGYACPLYDELYGDWRQHRRSALADGARKRTECLWLNPAAADRLPGRLFE